MRAFPLLPCLLLPALVAAQTSGVVPAIAASLPGNAAVSMPLRWSQGVLQVVVDHRLIPAAASAAGIDA